MRWCFKLKKAVELIEPNDNLAEAYIKKSNNSLDMVQLAISNNKKEWAVTTMYYCHYFALYALLQKIGINSENHTCTILLAKKFIKKIEKKYIDQIMKFKTERIEKQYYVAKSDLEFLDIPKLDRDTKEFQKYLFEIIHTITYDEIQDIRKKIKDFKESPKNKYKNKEK